jgi:hypothetical protein
LLLSLQLLACGGGGGGASTPSQPPPVCVDPCGITLSWSTSPEGGVNQAGGGYRVYVTNTPDAVLPNATSVTVAYDQQAGGTPTTAALQLTAGTWYVRITAYSALNTVGSAPSTALEVAVP